jgi:hypothetical protein
MHKIKMESPIDSQKSSLAVTRVSEIIQYPDFTLTVKPNPNRVIFYQSRFLPDDDTSRTAWRVILQTLNEHTLFFVHDVLALIMDPPDKSAYLRLGKPFVQVMCFLYPKLSFIRLRPPNPPDVWAEWEFLEMQCLPDHRQVRHFASMDAAERFMRNPEPALTVQ